MTLVSVKTSPRTASVILTMKRMPRQSLVIGLLVVLALYQVSIIRTLSNHNFDPEEVSVHPPLIAKNQQPFIFNLQQQLSQFKSPITNTNTHTNTNNYHQLTKSELLSRSEQIRIENNRTVHDPKKIFSHFYMHIPKAAGQYVHSQLSMLVWQVHKELITPATGETNGNTHVYRPCYMGIILLRNFHKKFLNTFYGERCNLWSSEQSVGKSPQKDTFNHAYTILRSPVQHVVSQYFHCKESKDHQTTGHRMPPLEEWLDYHVNRLVNVTMAWRKMHFSEHNCYDPINLQSYFAGFDKSVSEQDLYERFDLIGNMENVKKSTCAVAVRYTGYLPPVCDCRGHAINQTTIVESASKQHNHGVKHHGSTFELTPSQLTKIERLTTLDQLLYERASNVYQRQVSEIELEFETTLCDNPDLEGLKDRLQPPDRKTKKKRHGTRNQSKQIVTEERKPLVATKELDRTKKQTKKKQWQVQMTADELESQKQQPKNSKPENNGKRQKWGDHVRKMTNELDLSRKNNKQPNQIESVDGKQQRGGRTKRRGAGKTENHKGFLNVP